MDGLRLVVADLVPAVVGVRAVDDASADLRVDTHRVAATDRLVVTFTFRTVRLRILRNRS